MEEAAPEQSSHAEAWLHALQEATACLRHGASSAEDELNQCLNYLKDLESILRKEEANWHLPPKMDPPDWETAPTVNNNERARSSHNDHPVRFHGSNRFAGFQDDDDDSSFRSSLTDDEEAVAGDIPLLDLQSSSVVYAMDSRRLLIRILDAQSSVYATRAIHSRKCSPPQWTMGAEQCLKCLQIIQAALVLADTQISQWIASRRSNGMLPLLMEDADIVEVAVQSIASNRQSYLSAAQQQEAYLTRKLEPQWRSRDEIKEKMGDRWFSNPRPSNSFSKQRLALEQELKDIRAALESLAGMDMSDVELSSKRLKERLLGSHSASKKQRYNGKRPTDTSRRVDLERYPDPTEFGWKFTGSWGVTEFFERDGVKLDWYYTTATVKTSLDHPTRGKTQLFGAKVDPATYIMILLDPRTHTRQRYYQKQQAEAGVS